jgi:DNA-binding NarL/FixJ family response regulator
MQWLVMVSPAVIGTWEAKPGFGLRCQWYSLSIGLELRIDQARFRDGLYLMEECMGSSARWLLPTRHFVLLARHNLQSRLLCDSIVDYTGIECSLLNEAEFFAFVTDEPAARLPQQLMVMIDCDLVRADHLIALLEQMYVFSNDPVLALYNCHRNHPNENLMSWPGIRGIFHTESRQQELVHGIAGILGGHYWIPRDLLAQHLELTRMRPERRRDAAIGLTPRETEILVLLSRGITNQDIADGLDLSCHTVKTHIYNLFKKVSVSNRVQLVNWARMNGYDRSSVIASAQ